MKIIEVFPFYNEFSFLKLRSKVKGIYQGRYEFMPALLECDHQGNPTTINFQEGLDLDATDGQLHLLRQTKDEAIRAYRQHSKIYSSKGFSENWVYEVGQRKTIYDQLLHFFNNHGFPDILILNDADEILFEKDLQQLETLDSGVYRCAMDWRIADPRFRYTTRWPGSIILIGIEMITEFLSDDLSPVQYHLTRSLNNCNLEIGMHLTYFGGVREFRQKCKRIAEAKAKRVKLSSLIGPFLLKLGIDPMLRANLKIEHVDPEESIKHLCKEEWYSWL